MITYIFYAVLISLNIGFIVWCVIDTKKFSKKSRQKIDEFDDFCKKAIGEAIVSSGKKVENKLREMDERINILAKENVKLREQNEYLKDKLKNCGFTDIDIEL